MEPLVKASFGVLSCGRQGKSGRGWSSCGVLSRDMAGQAGLVGVRRGEDWRRMV